MSGHPSWQPIATAPRGVDTPFLGSDGETISVTWAGWSDNAKPVYVRGDWVSWKPTHWMPLPEMPGRDGDDVIHTPNPNEVREMLRAMQAGELTVSRGVELLDMWLAGNYSNDQLPPVRFDLIEEDSMPVEIIDRLRAELAALSNEQQMRRMTEARNAELIAQRDSLLSAIRLAEPVMEALAGPMRLAEFRDAAAKGGAA